MATLTRKIFCANDQTEKVHELYFGALELVAECTVCHRVLKFPAGLSREKFDALLEKHKNANLGQVTQESIDKKLEELADPVEG